MDNAVITVKNKCLILNETDNVKQVIIQGKPNITKEMKEKISCGKG